MTAALDAMVEALSQGRAEPLAWDDPLFCSIRWLRQDSGLGAQQGSELVLPTSALRFGMVQFLGPSRAGIGSEA